VGGFARWIDAAGHAGKRADPGAVLPIAGRAAVFFLWRFPLHFDAVDFPH
jgi:hypothetical protein